MAGGIKRITERVKAGAVKEPNPDRITGEHKRVTTEQAPVARTASSELAAAAVPPPAASLIAHLRGAIASVIYESGQLDHEPASGTVRRSVRRIFSTAVRIDRLLGDLGDQLDIDAGRLRLDRRRTDLGRLLARLASEIPAETRRQIQLELRNDVVVQVDPERLERVIAALIENAASHVAIGSGILVRLDRRGEIAIVTVSDHGPGLTNDQIKAAFEAQAPDGGPPLHVARRIVEAHGGKLDLESIAGKGTRYLIELPIYR